MVSTLQFGIILTLVAWIILLIATVHGKYVTEKIAAGEYEKGPVDGETDS